MRGPSDFEKLSEADLERVVELEREVEDWFADPHHGNCTISTVGDDKARRTPERVWRELVRRAEAAGWNAAMSGSTVSIEKP